MIIPEAILEVEMAKALEGVRILDLTQFAAGPFCTRILGDLGAEVIKIEKPMVGDGQRYIPPFIRGQPYTYLILNRNKKAITLNLESEKGKALFKELVRQAQVVAENFTPGTMERFGLGYEELKKVNPQIIYASVSGFGQTGPRRSWAAYDMVAQATGGIMSVTGHKGNPPTKVGPSIADYLGSLYWAVAILSALRHKERTGQGQAIDISMQDCAWDITAVEFSPKYFLKGELLQGFGNRQPNIAPFNCYRAKDGYVVICTAADPEWQRLAKAMGKEELASEPRFVTPSERMENVEELDSIIGEWTRARPMDEIVSTLVAAGVACGPVLNLDQVTRDPQLLSREMVVEVDHPAAGKIKMPGYVFKLSETPGRTWLHAPLMGEHNEEVFSTLLGYSGEEIARLREEGVI